MYYLFISGDETICVARSSNIFGPYEVYPEPIIKREFSWESTSAIAPTVLIENGKARMWYMGVVTSGTGADFAIGYAEVIFHLTGDGKTGLKSRTQTPLTHHSQVPPVRDRTSASR
jgi:hypothetical protein